MTYRKGNAKYLTRNRLLLAKRVIGVETDGYPHNAFCEDASIKFRNGLRNGSLNLLYHIRMQILQQKIKFI